MDAKRMFQRVLSAWAMDVLALKRRGWDRPCVRSIQAGFGIGPSDRRESGAQSLV